MHNPPARRIGEDQARLKTVFVGHLRWRDECDVSFTQGGSGHVSSPGAQFNADDVPQIRIRWDPSP
jgi:hypothetical protein